jgi:transposase InsO family protein
MRLLREKSEATGRPYPLRMICAVMGVPRSSFYAHRRTLREERRERKKPGPKMKVDDAGLLAKIREVLARSPFHTEGTKKVHRRLRGWLGIRASRHRVNRLMREAGVLSPQRIEADREKRKHEGSIIPPAIDLLWGTDGTQFGLANGRLLWLFAAIDHYSCEILGWHIIEVGQGDAWAALEPVKQALSKRRGPLRQQSGVGVSIRHDWGPQYTAGAFRKELDFLGLGNSPAFVHEPETNGVIERFFRTIKEECLWLHDFRDAQQAREIVGRWIETYNGEWMIERNQYRTPREARLACEAARAAIAA